MDLGQFPEILEGVITDLVSRLEPLIHTTTSLPQIKEVTTLNKKLRKSYEVLNHAQQMIPEVIESLQLHALEEGNVPNNVRAGVTENIRKQQERDKARAEAIAYADALRAKGDEVLEMRGGKRKKQKRVTRRR